MRIGRRRFLGFIALGLAIFVAGALAWIALGDHSARVRTLLVTGARSLLGRDVDLDGVVVDVPHFTFRLRGIRVAALEPGPPFLEVDSIEGRLSPAALFTREIRLKSLVVRGVRLRVTDFGGGRIDVGLSSGATRPSGTGIAPLVRLASDRVEVKDAAFLYENVRVPWRLEASGLSSSLGESWDGVYRGHLAYREGSFSIKGRSATEASVEAHFEVSENELKLRELHATGGFYTLNGAGTLYLGRRPDDVQKFLRAALTFNAEAEVGPAVRSLIGVDLLEAPSGRRGKLSGQLHMGPGWHEMKATATIPQASLWNLPLHDWQGEILWDRGSIAIREARGILADGAATLSLTQAFPTAAHRTEIALRLEAASLSSLLGTTDFASRISGAASLDFLPAAPLDWSGTFNVTGVAPPEAEHRVDLTAKGRFRPGGVDLTEGTLATRGLSARISGVLAPDGLGGERRETSAALTIEAADLAEADRFQRAIRDFFDPSREASLLSMTGAGRASGRLTARTDDFEFEGTASASNLVFRGLPLGRVETEGRLTPREVSFTRFVARKEGGELRGSGAATLPFKGDFRLAARSSDWPAADVERVTGFPLNLSGRLSGDLDLVNHGSLEGGEGSALVSVAPGSLYGVPFEKAAARVDIIGARVTLKGIRVEDAGSTVEGVLELDRAARSATGSFDVRGLSPSRLGLDGLTARFDGRVTLGGTFDAPLVDIEGAAPDLRVRDVPLGRAELRGRFEAGRFAGNLAFSQNGSRALVAGEVGIEKGFPARGRLSWETAELGSLVRAAHAEVPSSFSLRSSGSADFEGSLSPLTSLRARARVTALELAFGDYRMTTVAPFALELRERRLHVDALDLGGLGTKLRLDGSLGVDGEDVDVQVSGSVNPEILEDFLPSLEVSGRTDLSARIRGRLGEPLLSGHADLASGSLRLRDFPQGFGDIKGRLDFDNRTVVLTRLDCRFGGAPVTLSGRLFLKGLSPDVFEIRGTGRGVRIRYPAGLSATIDTDLLLTGTLREQILSGRVSVQDAAWSREYDLTTEMLGARDKEEVAESSALDGLRFDIRVEAPGRSLHVRNSQAVVDASADVQLRGTYARPALLGRAEAQRGEVFFMGQRYALTASKVDFVDPLAIRPLFDITAQTRVRSYQIQLHIVGTPDRFFPELTSDPPLRTVDILRLLAGGSERDVQLGTEEEEVAGVGVAGLLTGRLTQEIGRRAGRLFGLDRFSIDPFLIGQVANPTARVTLGKRISRDITISYSTNLNATTDTIVLIEYNTGGRFSWVLSRDETGAFGIDFKIRRGF